MSQLTETPVRYSPADQIVDNFLAPVPEHLSAMTAARSIARFLIEHPEFANDRHIGWIPQYNGDVTVEVRNRRADGATLMGQLAGFLEAELNPTAYNSATYGPMVSLTLYATYQGAEWFAVSAVLADVWAGHLAAQQPTATS